MNPVILLWNFVDSDKIQIGLLAPCNTCWMGPFFLSFLFLYFFAAFLCWLGIGFGAQSMNNA
jgi:hypothetical protein